MVSGAAFLNHGCASRSDMVALLSTSTSRHLPTKSLKSDEIASGCFSLGVPFVAIKYRAYWKIVSLPAVRHRNWKKRVSDLKWLLVEVRGFSLNHLDGHNTQAPDIHLRAIVFLLDDFGGHPVRGAHHRGSLPAVLRDTRTKPKVGCDNRENVSSRAKKAPKETEERTYSA